MRRSVLNFRKAIMGGLIPFLKLLPSLTAHRIVASIGHIEYRLFPKLRHGVDQAVERGAVCFGARWDSAHLGRALSGNLIRWRTRDVLLDSVADAKLDHVITVKGRQLLDRAFGQGKGVILLGSHFGAHLVPPHWLARSFYPIRLYMEKPRRVSKFLSRQFKADGPFGQRGLFISRRADATDGASAVMKAVRILKAGMIVYLAGDVRWSGQHTAPALFLGKTRTFSTTWAILASITQAPVVPVFCVMNADGTHRLEFLASFQVPPEIGRSAETAPWVQKCLETIESWVQRYPCNSNDYFFWDDPQSDTAVKSLAEPLPIENSAVPA